jgi:hypothetical protein
MGEPLADWRAVARQTIEDAEREGVNPLALFRQRLREDHELAKAVALELGAPLAIKRQRTRLILERAAIGVQALALLLSE